MVAKLKALVAEMGRKPYREEVFAALHLRDLQAAGEPRTWSDLRTRAGTEHSRWVHPAQLYDAISLVLIFVFTSAVFYRRGPAGATIAWGMMLYGINRFVQEMIRGDNPRDTFGLTISQFMSLLILAAGVVMLLYFTDPLRRASDVTEQVSSAPGRQQREHGWRKPVRSRLRVWGGISGRRKVLCPVWRAASVGQYQALDARLHRAHPGGRHRIIDVDCGGSAGFYVCNVVGFLIGFGRRFGGRQQLGEQFLFDRAFRSEVEVALVQVSFGLVVGQFRAVEVEAQGGRCG
jgi:hypothetical protein